MPDAFLTPVGEIIAPDDLRLEKAAAVATLLQSTPPFMRLVECRRLVHSVMAFLLPAGSEGIVFEVEVEVGQRLVHEIHAVERLTVWFRPEDIFPYDCFPPEVQALRADFPQVPHLILWRQEFPRSLCLDDASYDEQKLHWTAVGFVSRVRAWLALTARGQLHAQDQPLEPLLLGHVSPLVISDGFLEAHNTDSRQWRIRTVPSRNGSLPFLTAVPDAADGEFLAVFFSGLPQNHGIIRWQPENLADLHEFLTTAGLDLRAELRRHCRRWAQQTKSLACRLIIVVALPKTRTPGGLLVTTEYAAFASRESIEGIGIALGVWRRHPVYQNALAIPFVKEHQRGKEIGLTMLNPIPAFSREQAARLNGLPDVIQTRITAIGMGALGSQLALNLARAGIGNWAIVDEDTFYPHNIGRHALSGKAIGHPKAEKVAELMNEILSGPPIARALVADVLHPGNKKKAVTQALTEADVILDLSASVAVARYLAGNPDSAARRISLFLDPDGEHMVLLAEDAARTVRLDHLEMQLCRYLVQTEQTLSSTGTRIRYGRTCRDVSSNLPQNRVALHAAAAACALQTVLAQSEAAGMIWRVSQGGLGLETTSFGVVPTIHAETNGWTLCTDARLLEDIHTQRASKLPRETGGVLLGSYDMQRRILYVVDSVPSPRDSDEQPTSYVRGIVGLEERLQTVQKLSGGALGYVGEWHSHSPGYDCAPSRKDHEHFAYLSEQLGKDGHPALMLIVGEKQHEWYVDRLEPQ